MIVRDIRRDDLVLPERRWPYLSTRAPVAPSAPPKFDALHQAAPQSGDTLLFKARRAQRAKEKLEAAQAVRARESEDKLRLSRQKV